MQQRTVEQPRWHRTVEQIVVVPVPQVVHVTVEVDPIAPRSVSSTETLMCQWRYNAKYQQSRQFRRQWRFYRCSPCLSGRRAR